MWGGETAGVDGMEKSIRITLSSSRSNYLINYFVHFLLAHSKQLQSTRFSLLSSTFDHGFQELETRVKRETQRDGS